MIGRRPYAEFGNSTGDRQITPPIITIRDQAFVAVDQ
jgi:hypothetical protein